MGVKSTSYLFRSVVPARPYCAVEAFMPLHHQKNSVSLTQSAQAVQGQKSIIIFSAAEIKFPPCVDLLCVSTTSICLLHRCQLLLLLLRPLFGVMAVFRRWTPPVVLVFSPQGEYPPGTQRGCSNSYDGGIIFIVTL